MATRVRPGEQAGWRAELRHGATLLLRDGFADRDTAEEWCAQASLALKQCTVRVSTKRFLGSGAEALRRWAIDQGTLPWAEGGTQIAPVRRLAGLMDDPACAWPMSLLTPQELAALRRRRCLALGDAAAGLVEQAALAAALEQFRDFHLPALDDPFAEPAPDGLCILDDAALMALQERAATLGAEWPRLISLMLGCIVPWQDLLRSCCGQADPRTGSLHLPDGRAVRLPAGFGPDPEAAADLALLPGLDPAGVEAGFAALGPALSLPGLRPEALQLTAMAQALHQGEHLDEILIPAGAGPSRQG